MTGTPTTADPADEENLFDQMAEGRDTAPRPAQFWLIPSALRAVPGNPQHLDRKWRLYWLRCEHPEAVIATAIVSQAKRHQEGPREAVVRAQVVIPEGGSATGHALASEAEAVDYVALAEDRALFRALSALGYGTQFDLDDDLDDDLAPPPATANVPETATAPPPPPALTDYLHAIDVGRVTAQTWPSFWNTAITNLSTADQKVLREHWKQHQAARP